MSMARAPARKGFFPGSAPARPPANSAIARAAARVIREESRLIIMVSVLRAGLLISRFVALPCFSLPYVALGCQMGRGVAMQGNAMQIRHPWPRPSEYLGALPPMLGL